MMLSVYTPVLQCLRYRPSAPLTTELKLITIPTMLYTRGLSMVRYLSSIMLSMHTVVQARGNYFFDWGGVKNTRATFWGVHKSVIINDSKNTVLDSVSRAASIRTCGCVPENIWLPGSLLIWLKLNLKKVFDNVVILLPYMPRTRRPNMHDQTWPWVQFS